MISSASKAKADHDKKLEDQQRQLEENQRRIESEKIRKEHAFESNKNSLAKTITVRREEFDKQAKQIVDWARRTNFIVITDTYPVTVSRINTLSRRIERNVSQMKSDLQAMKETWSKFPDVKEKSELLKVISTCEVSELPKNEDWAQRAQSNLVKIRKSVEDFRNMIIALPYQGNMFNGSTYGSVNQSYYRSIESEQSAQAESILQRAEEALRNNANLIDIDPNDLLKDLWFYAFKKPFSFEKFNTVSRAFQAAYGFVYTKEIEIKSDSGTQKKTVPNEEAVSIYPDLFLAEAYTKRQIGGEEALRDMVNELLKNSENDKGRLLTIASGLMWMKAFEAEKNVLQFMVKNNIPMPENVQQRIHSLSSAQGNTPDHYDYSSNESCLYFDITSIAWNQDEYNNLFDSLAFQEKKLEYSLAVREMNKDLFIPLSMVLPGTKELADKIRSVTEDELGDSIQVKAVRAIALSGKEQEPLSGVLLKSSDIPQLGIFLNVNKIGKKLNLTFYTLYMANAETELIEQKDQAIRMFKKTSPTVNLWENSMINTAQVAMQQVINTEKDHNPEESEIKQLKTDKSVNTVSKEEELEF